MQQGYPSQPNLNQSDEIDLFELFENIWNQKWLVIICTLVALAIGSGYAFLTQPTYEATAYLLPPTSQNIVELRQDSTLNSESNNSQSIQLQHVSTEEVYSTFIAILQANQTKRAFLNQTDVNDYFAQLAPTPQSQWKIFSENALAISVPQKPPINNVNIAFRLDNPELAADFANRYVALATQMTRLQLANDLRAEIKSKINTVELQIQNRKSLYISQLNTELSKLHEALKIAETIGLETPLKTDTIIDDTSKMMVDEVRKLYRLGTRALDAEITAIDARRHTEAFIPGLMQLQQQLSLLSSMTVNENKIIPVTIDLLAEAPETPIKPKKALILALSVVLGGMLGVMIALIRSAICNRKASHTAA